MGIEGFTFADARQKVKS